MDTRSLKPLAFFILSALIMCSASAFAGNFLEEVNRTDELGRKQGYWIISGYMSNDSKYEPTATVEEGTFVDDKKEGLWKKYFPNGKIKTEIHFIKDKPNGPYSVYYENGQLEEKGNWGRNKNTGDFKRFYKNGNPQQEFTFSEKGLRNGVQSYYHSNGKKALEVKIVEGKETGTMRRWNEKGELVETKEMNGGVLVAGSIKEHKPKPKNAPKVDIPENAKESKVTKDKTNKAFDFLPNGYNVLYNKDRQISQAGEFKSSRLWDGKWYRYNSDGILIRIEIYKSGKYVGNGIIETEE